MKGFLELDLTNIYSSKKRQKSIFSTQNFLIHPQKSTALCYF